MTNKKTRSPDYYGAQRIKELETVNRVLVEALKMARECIVYCRRAHKGAQTGEGIPVETFIDEVLKLAKEQP